MLLHACELPQDDGSSWLLAAAPDACTVHGWSHTASSLTIIAEPGPARSIAALLRPAGARLVALATVAVNELASLAAAAVCTTPGGLMRMHVFGATQPRQWQLAQWQPGSDVSFTLVDGPGVVVVAGRTVEWCGGSPGALASHLHQLDPQRAWRPGGGPLLWAGRLAGALHALLATCDARRPDDVGLHQFLWLKLDDDTGWSVASDTALPLPVEYVALATACLPIVQQPASLSASACDASAAASWSSSLVLVATRTQQLVACRRGSVLWATTLGHAASKLFAAFDGETGNRLIAWCASRESGAASSVDTASGVVLHTFADLPVGGAFVVGAFGGTGGDLAVAVAADGQHARVLAASAASVAEQHGAAHSMLGKAADALQTRVQLERGRLQHLQQTLDARRGMLAQTEAVLLSSLAAAGRVDSGAEPSLLSIRRRTRMPAALFLLDGSAAPSATSMTATQQEPPPPPRLLPSPYPRFVLSSLVQPTRVSLFVDVTHTRPAAFRAVFISPHTCQTDTHRLHGNRLLVQITPPQHVPVSLLTGQLFFVDMRGDESQAAWLAAELDFGDMAGLLGGIAPAAPDALQAVTAVSTVFLWQSAHGERAVMDAMCRGMPLLRASVHSEHVLEACGVRIEFDRDTITVTTPSREDLQLLVRTWTLCVPEDMVIVPVWPAAHEAFFSLARQALAGNPRPAALDLATAALLRVLVATT